MLTLVRTTCVLPAIDFRYDSVAAPDLLATEKVFNAFTRSWAEATLNAVFLPLEPSLNLMMRRFKCCCEPGCSTPRWACADDLMAAVVWVWASANNEAVATATVVAAAK